MPIFAQATLPYLQEISINQQPLPQLQPGKFYQSQGTQYSQYNQNFDRYFVYVDSNNYEILQRVRQIEPNAYIRNYNGRKVIQSGVFNEQFNAQQRVKELEFNNIAGARIVNSENIEFSYFLSIKSECKGDILLNLFHYLTKNNLISYEYIGVFDDDIFPFLNRRECK
jgi:hypothetical protein